MDPQQVHSLRGEQNPSQGEEQIPSQAGEAGDRDCILSLPDEPEEVQGSTGKPQAAARVRRWGRSGSGKGDVGGKSAGEEIVKLGW